MARHLRIVGFVMIAIGAVVLLSYVFDPLRMAWHWFRSMPMPLQVGLAIAAVGLVVLMISLMLEKRRDDRDEPVDIDD